MQPDESMLQAMGIASFFALIVGARWLWGKLTDPEMKGSASFWLSWFKRRK